MMDRRARNSVIAPLTCSCKNWRLREVNCSVKIGNTNKPLGFSSKRCNLCKNSLRKCWMRGSKPIVKNLSSIYRKLWVSRKLWSSFNSRTIVWNCKTHNFLDIMKSSKPNISSCRSNTTSWQTSKLIFRSNVGSSSRKSVSCSKLLRRNK